MNYEIDPNTLEEYLNRPSTQFVDVRSPSEFSTATIPGAVNIPLFSDEEREMIGYTYVQKSTSEAKRLGVSMVSRRLPDIYARIEALMTIYDDVILFCSRGGMRSCTLFELLRALKLPIKRLKGGYKGYRHFILNHLDALTLSYNYIVLWGMTGTGKTQLLMRLKDEGYNVLDLEGLANHRGSLLGHIGLGTQPTQKHFESLIYDALHSMPEGPVFVESESRKIGSVSLPQGLVTAMAESPYIEVTDTLEHRVERLLLTYPKDHDAIKKALELMSPYIGKAPVSRLFNALDNNDYAMIATYLIENYYDRNYKRALKPFEFTVSSSDENTAVAALTAYASQLKSAL
ncbi:tRNA 2-selenouridine(34) synthase MnmH [Peptoniphilus equinus]|uniref:tRNA 2-selenouridine(34) synthase MnmH n=1 Tax=Peptoniphilus equinus TaxID=3016343 RepID=A0ABY7QUY2_9FIRM|nr:tRNA 2-selenouridine(34) synthase MnmH [Peptoniphilus equinus]WBW50586.1 tRNA 2-selenouridine(34) synthase MnmH [Peptoniphilus equinus]